MATRLLGAGEVCHLNSQWQRSAHSHSYTELICFEEGRGHVVVGNEEYVPQAGSVLIYRPTIRHEEKADPQIGQHTYWLGILGPAFSGLPTHSHDTTGEIRWLFSALIREKRRASTDTALAAAYLTALIELLNRITGQSQAHWTDKVQTYINEHFREPDLTLKKLSAEVGISTSAITHEFHRFFGLPISRYILNLRLSEAKTLLRTTSLPVKIIATHVGFNDPCYFSAKFHRECSQSPDSYRKCV